MVQLVEGSKDAHFFVLSLPVNENLRLRDDVMSYAKIREWVFKGRGQKNTILLSPPTEEYEWEAKIEDIDWNEYKNRKLKNPGQK